jgi:DNA invertase Pin-like site-specific DNA recombinase
MRAPCACTRSSATRAQRSNSSPHSTVAATISAGNAKLDRFSRWLPYGVKIIDRIDQAGGLFVAAAAFDLRTDSGRLHFHVMLSFADYELRRFRTGWRQARETLILERGQHWGLSVPLGYRRGEDGRLDADPQTSRLLRALFERRAAGAGLTELARWLDDKV